MLLGILIGVYFTLNIVLTIYFAYNDWLDEWEPMKWYWWPIMILFGTLILIGLGVFQLFDSVHKWMYTNNWYYCWINDTLQYEKNLGIVNRADRRKLTFVASAQLSDTWPSRKLSERINERVKEMER